MPDSNHQPKRRMILVPLDSNGEHHAPRGYDRVRNAKEIERLNNRMYEIRDYETGEVIKSVEI